MQREIKVLLIISMLAISGARNIQRETDIVQSHFQKRTQPLRFARHTEARKTDRLVDEMYDQSLASSLPHRSPGKSAEVLWKPRTALRTLRSDPDLGLCLATLLKHGVLSGRRGLVKLAATYDSEGGSAKALGSLEDSKLHEEAQGHLFSKVSQAYGAKDRSQSMHNMHGLNESKVEDTPKMDPSISSTAPAVASEVALAREVSHKNMPSIDFILIFLTLVFYVGNWYHNAANKIAIKAAGGVTGYPLLTACGYFLVGACYAIFLWSAPDARKLPKITVSDFKKMIPVSLFTAAAHMAFVFALSCGSLSLVQIVKGMEPAVAALIGTIFYKSHVSLARWLCLIPVIGGVALASSGEASFAWDSLIVASMGNIFASIRSNENKKLMQTEGLKERVGSVSQQFAISMVTGSIGCILLALMFEGHKLAAFIELITSSSHQGITLRNNVIFSGLWFYLYNEVGTMIIDRTDVVTQSVLNTGKRGLIILGASLLLSEGLTAAKLVGSFVSIIGIFLHSIIDRFVKKTAKD